MAEKKYPSGTKTRWGQAEYRRHMFNLGRGVSSPHDVTNTKGASADVLGWTTQDGLGGFLKASWRAPWSGDLSAQKEYEQYQNPGSDEFTPFTLDRTQREKFREQDRKEVRKLFKESLGAHHFAKNKKVTDGQLDKIVDAYMRGDDDKFSAALGKMGIEGRDAQRWRRAAEESATAAIEGKAYGSKWDDDDYAKPPTEAIADANATPVSGGSASTSTAGDQPAGPRTTQGKDVPLNPRKPAGSASVPKVDVSTNNVGTGDAAHDTYIDGVSDRNQTDVVSHLNGAARSKAAIVDIQANDARKDALQNSRIQDEERQRDEIRRKAEQGDETKKYWADRAEKRKAAADAAYADRMERRYQEGKLSSMDDWRNLGREGSNRRNYSAVEGETDAQKKEREAEVAKRNGKIAELQQKAARMADKTLLKNGETLTWEGGKRIVKDADGNVVSDKDLAGRSTTGVGTDGYTYDKDSFYASNPNKMKHLEGLRKAFEEGVAKGTLTDKQIDAFEAKLGAWENEGKSNRAKIDAANAERVAMKNMELRQKYGFTDRDPSTGQYLMSDDELGAYHKGKQAEAVKKTLGEMAQRGFVDTEEGYRDYGKSWRTLMENGVSMPGAIADAVKGMTPEQRKAYNDQLAAATSPEAKDTIRQNAALSHLYKANGIDIPGAADGQGFVAGHTIATANSNAIAEHNGQSGSGGLITPVGSTSELSAEQQDTLRPRVEPRPTQAPVAPATQTPVAAPNPAEGQSLADALKKKKELTQQAYGGGYTPLRPRRFRG